MPDLTPSPSQSPASDNTNSAHQKRRYNNNSHHHSKNNGGRNHIGRRPNKKESASYNEEFSENKKGYQDVIPRRDKSENKGNRRNVNSDSEPRQKNKKIPYQNEGGKRRQKSKPEKHDKKTGKGFKVPIDRSKKELSVRRETEINQCIHVLSNRNFRLFKRGQYVTSYGFTRNQKLLGIPNCKFIVNIPLDYPKSPMKLQYGKSNIQQQEQAAALEERLERLTKNINYKSSQLVHQGEPIISQLNYLVEKAEFLSQPGFKSIDKREKDFYRKFA